jgi:hypothetical protein
MSSAKAKTTINSENRSLVLFAKDVAEFKNKTRRSARARELRAMRILFRVRSDGSVVVLRVHIEYETEENPCQKHLPKSGYERQGAYYFVNEKGRWIPLGRDLAAALTKCGADSHVAG